MMHKYESPKRVGLIGARGYSGLELARILLRHPGVELAACFAGEKSFQLSEYLPETMAAKVPVLPLKEENLKGFHTIFLATPAEASLEWAPKVLEAGAHCIDLSGAFRLKTGDTLAEKQANYQKWYGFSHPEPTLLEKAVYGISPFSPPSGFRPPQLVANPGCYSTCILMALIPLLKGKAVQPKTIVIDAKSGTSGAGRKAAENLLFTEVEGECLPYRVGKHQHLPEITEWASHLGREKIDPFFTTHLLPVRRGIIAGIYAELQPDVTPEKILQIYAQSFGNYPLVKVQPIDQAANLLSLKRVVGSARTHIQFQVVGNKLYLFSLIDNLLKGAASQAIENFNRLADYPVDLALSELEGTL
jgi:N-acetyl-gamma-glutamyl-phosphate reductase